MAKTYLDIVKYMVEASFNIGGLVEKPDIIGAVFGQTEGLLGDELDLRELQKNGKIGRIEIDTSQSGNKTYGKLFLPASLGRVETCILAAAVESVDRVGPYDAQFQILKVEDTRSEKRKKVLDRAKELVKQLLTTEIPDSKELAEMVQSEVKSSEITTYGPEKLPAGPDIKKSNELILVEGRADVLNLLRYDITNVIAVGGAASVIPTTIKELCNEKEVTIFVDGDKGGDMIIRSLLSAAEADFITKAPDGKEVEELTRKEVLKSLRSRVPLDQYLGRSGMKQQRPQMQRPAQQPQQYQQPQQQQQQQRPQPQPQRPAPQPLQQNRQPTPPPSPSSLHIPAQQVPQHAEEEAADEEDAEMSRIPSIDEGEEEDSAIPSIEPQRYARPDKQEPYGAAQAKPALESMMLSQLSTGLTELANTLRSRLYDASGSVIVGVPIRELIAKIQETHGVYAIVLDGVITQRLVELALENGIKAIYGVRANPMPKKHPELLIYTTEQGKTE